MLTVKDVIDFLQALPPDMEVPAILCAFGGADHLNLAFERQAVEERQRQAQQESDEGYAAWIAYRDAHQNIPVDSDLFMETEIIEDNLLNTFTEADGRELAIRRVLESCIEAFIDSNMALLNKVEAEIAQLPQYGSRRKT
jgi:hypothetical protein